MAAERSEQSAGANAGPNGIDVHELGERVKRMRTRFDEFRGRL